MPPLQTVTVVAKGTLPVGRQTSAGIAVPINTVLLIVRCDRVDWTDKDTRLNAEIELSTDAGASWRPWGSVGSVGGSITDAKTGLPATTTGLEVGLPQPTNANRRIRATLEASHALTTSLLVEFW